MTRNINVGGNQGRGNPPAFVREFDTLRERMRQPKPRYSIPTALWAAFLVMLAVAVASLFTEN